MGCLTRSLETRLRNCITKMRLGMIVESCPYKGELPSQRNNSMLK